MVFEGSTLLSHDFWMYYYVCVPRPKDTVPFGAYMDFYVACFASSIENVFANALGKSFKEYIFTHCVLKLVCCSCDAAYHDDVPWFVGVLSDPFDTEVLQKGETQVSNPAS